MTSLDKRLVMALATESRRMTEAAERVRLVIRAMELKHGVRVAGDSEDPTITSS